MSKPSRKRRNPLEVAADTRFPVPHTSAWFEDLLPIDTHKAMMTAAIVEHAGCLDICSICGEDPAPIYHLLDEPYVSIRLCCDCLEIRTVGFGERYRQRLPAPVRLH